MMKHLLIAAAFSIAAGPALAETPAGQAYTEGKYFSVVFPAGWVKKEKALGLPDEEKKVFGVEFFGPIAGGLAVMLGFRTRLAAFLCSGTMAVAYFQFHWKFQFGSLFFPGINKGELAVLYCFVFLFIACRGGVLWCLDKK